MHGAWEPAGLGSASGGVAPVTDKAAPPRRWNTRPWHVGMCAGCGPARGQRDVRDGGEAQARAGAGAVRRRGMSQREVEDEPVLWVPYVRCRREARDDQARGIIVFFILPFNSSVSQI